MLTGAFTVPSHVQKRTTNVWRSSNEKETIHESLEIVCQIWPDIGQTFRQTLTKDVVLPPNPRWPSTLRMKLPNWTWNATIGTRSTTVFVNLTSGAIRLGPFPPMCSPSSDVLWCGNCLNGGQNGDYDDLSVIVACKFRALFLYRHYYFNYISSKIIPKFNCL